MNCTALQAEDGTQQALEASKRLRKAQGEADKLRGECEERELALQQLRTAYDELTCRCCHLFYSCYTF